MGMEGFSGEFWRLSSNIFAAQGLQFGDFLELFQHLGVVLRQIADDLGIPQQGGQVAFRQRQVQKITAVAA